MAEMRQRLRQVLYGKQLRRVTVVVACLLLGSLYAACAVVFLRPYLVDTPYGADPESGGAGSPASSAASQAALLGTLLGM